MATKSRIYRAIFLLGLSSFIAGCANEPQAPAPQGNDELDKIQRLIEQGNAQDALPAVTALKKRLYQFQCADQATGWQQYGLVHEMLDNYTEAEAAYKRLLDVCDLQPSMKSSARVDLARIYFIQKQYSQAISEIKYLASRSIKVAPEGWAILGQSYYHLGDCKKAIFPLDKAITFLERENKTVKNDWRVDLAASKTCNSKHVHYDKEKSPVILVRVPPMYPQRAFAKRIEGYAVVEFTVNEQGTTENIKVLEAYDITGDPTNVFNRSVTKAVRVFKYEPKQIDNRTVKVHGVQYKFTFMMH